jgi:hypothetical protein
MKMIDPKYIFDAARDFQIGSGFLAEQFGQPIWPLRSTVVTAAFAAELYLKCLLFLTTNAIPHAHGLVDLFDKLLPETKNLVEEMYHRVTSDSKSSFREALDEHNKTFVDWRYLFEQQDGAFNLNFKPLLNASSALQQAILGFRPEWKSG